MAIEAVNGMMSIQAQSVTAPKPAPAPREAAEFDSVQAADPAAKVDQTTRVVESSQEKGDTKDGNPEERQGASNEQIKKAVEKINQSKMAQSEAIFGIHEGTNRVTIKIVDKKTKETIKELPPEKTLDMIARVWEMAGLLVDEKR
ncbi:MAG: flagellar protein FlaG [Lachnospiraceae bacterium]|nr:flagellar protein FlaG [Lachnospiraceae bacterium]